MKTIKIKPTADRCNWHAEMAGYKDYFGMPSVLVCSRFISTHFPDLKKSREITLQLNDRPLRDSIVLFVYKTDHWNTKYSTSPKVKKPRGAFYWGTKQWVDNNFRLKPKEIKKIYIRAK